MSTPEELWSQTLALMENAFRRLEDQAPKPRREFIHGLFVFRYAEPRLELALLQKLARQISGVSAARLLHDHGFYQEQGALQRTLDEIGEDITFLSLALTNDRVTPLHEQFLEAFWQEEFDAETALSSAQKRNLPPRRKIRAYLHRHTGLPDPSTADEVSRTVSKMYSGYVHAASPHIMDMCWGEPPRFQLRGMAHTPLRAAHHDDLWNYLYRGILSVCFVAKAFGDASLVEELYVGIRTLDEALGITT